MIKPVAWLFQHEETGVVHIVDCQQVEWGFEKNNPRLQKIGPLYAIPDTHCIMPVRLTKKMIEAALPELMREDDEDKHRALGQLICVWDALVEAAKEETNDHPQP
jgi:hypothetical protein